MVSILVGLKYNRTAPMNSDAIYYKDVFDNSKEYGDKTVSSSDINSETMMASGEYSTHSEPHRPALRATYSII